MISLWAGLDVKEKETNEEKCREHQLDIAVAACGCCKAFHSLNLTSPALSLTIHIADAHRVRHSKSIALTLGEADNPHDPRPFRHPVPSSSPRFDISTNFHHGVASCGMCRFYIPFADCMERLSYVSS